MKYIILIAILFLLEIIYFKLADHFNIIDKPNHRSSHDTITLRGGGIIFCIALIISYILGDASLALVGCIFIVSLVSFIDDIKPLPSIPRLLVQLLAIIGIFYDLSLFQESIWLLPIMLIGMLAWVNAFNFMDGINGITVLYSLIAIISFSYIFRNDTSINVLITVGLSCLVFGFFNVRKKAKTFAGDVGSIAMAFFLGYMMLKSIFYFNNLSYILFFSVYGIDAFITILFRLAKKENILKPHRSHLYQFLANELKWSHLSVSLLYSVIQIIINVLVIYLIEIEKMNIIIVVSILGIETLIYLLLRNIVIRKLKFIS